MRSAALPLAKIRSEEDVANVLSEKRAEALNHVQELVRLGQPMRKGKGLEEINIRKLRKRDACLPVEVCFHLQFILSIL